MIRYSTEEMDESLVLEIKDLLKIHWEEIAMYKDKVVFDPDYDLYYKLNEDKKLLTITVRDEGRLVGYFLVFLFYHPHYKNDLYANTDILFIDKKYRGGTTAYRLFKFVEKQLRKLDVSVFLISMKTQHPFEGLCEALDMNKHEITYSKYLGK